MTQEEAFAILKAGVNVFLTGEPGSGKTHTINRYITWLNERGVDVAVTASTGIAATHVNGMTIHSWSGIGIKRDLNDYDVEMVLAKEKTAKRIIDAKVLIIDEISMLDATTLNDVDRVLRALRRRPMREEEPFGGLQIIFVGDFFQLPPVSKNGSTRFAFESDAWKAANPVVCYLSEQHRQEDDVFLSVLTAMRHGRFSEAHHQHLARRKTVAPKHSVATRLYTHNADVDRINAEALEAIAGKSHVYHMSSRGGATLVDALKKSCLSPETLTLKEGAAVMFTRNNFDAGYVNGTLGTVVGFTQLGAPIVETRRGERITVEAIDWAIQDGAKVLAKISQIPLRLAWAITVHKSQGMSLDAAIIDLSSAFEYGQGYVALSRVRSLAGLFLEGLNQKALAMHPLVVEKDRYFRAYSEAAAKKFASLNRAEKETLEKNFLRAIGAHEPGREHTSAGVPPRRTTKNDTGDTTEHEAIREKHPYAYKKWNEDDDALLAVMFEEKRPIQEIATHFERQASAIKARLAHLGLIPNVWKAKRKKVS